MATTTNLGLTKPTVGADDDTWGTTLNTQADGFDAVFAAAGSGTSVGIKVGSGKTLNALDGTVVIGDAGLTIKDTADPTKILALQCSGITAGQTRTLTIPDASGTIALTSTVAVPQGHINGLILSTAGSSATFGIAAGQAADGANAALMSLGSAYTKTTSAWALGTAAGALDTGAIANSTWYHVWLIQRSDTLVVDVLISTSATAPTMPTDYDRKRRIGSMKTDGSAQWIKFIQVGNRFDWATAIDDVATAPAGTTAVSQTLTVPTGVGVEALMDITLQYGSGSLYAYFTALDTVDVAASGSYFGVTITAQNNSMMANIRTNTSAQIRMRASATTGSWIIRTTGWVDQRGANG